MSSPAAGSFGAREAQVSRAEGFSLLLGLGTAVVTEKGLHIS